MTSAPPSLWRDRAFVTLWVGWSVSALGSQITVFALPVAAALSLGASPAQMGYLTAAGFAPSVAFGLIAGVWIDRLPRRPILIAADMGRAALLATIPAAAVGGVLGVGQLYAVALLAGTLGLVADVARGSILPSLVGRPALADANAKLAMSASLARVFGRGLSGALVQLVTAPIAIAADALSFVVSAACLMRVTVAEVPPHQARRKVWDEIAEGLRVVWDSPPLRTHTGATGLLNFFAGAITAVEILFFTRELGIAPTVLGTLLAAGSAAAILGAAIGAPAVARFGLGPAIVGSLTLFGVAQFAVALASGPPALVIALLVLGIGGIQLAFPVYGIGSAALLQGITPDHLLGRVGASVRFLLQTPPLLGALAGGAAGEYFGLRETVLLGAIGQLVPCVWLYLSPVLAVREAAPSPVGMMRP